MVNFKYLQKILFFLFMGVSMCALQACSEDDDDNDGGSGNIKRCYAEVDDYRADFKYAYYYEEDEEYGEKEIELTFHTLDMMYYYKNPSKIKKGILFSDAYVEFMDEVPTGTTTEYGIELDFNLDLYDMMYDEYDGELHGENYAWYCDDWAQEKTPISVARDGYFFKIDAKSVKMLAGDEEDDGIDSKSRKTTANFYFEGTAVDVSNIAAEASATRGIQVVKVDKEFMNWLKALKNK